jgi:phosphatidylinositol alpha-1,6-mannosyltransferase
MQNGGLFGLNPGEIGYLLMTMDFLLLVPGLSSIGGMQKSNRLFIKAVDAFLHREGGRLVVLSLNDPEIEPVLDDLRDLQVTRILGCEARKWRFSLLATRYFRQADSVFFGLLGFTPLVFLQRMVSPRSRCFLLIHGIEVWQKRLGPYIQAVHQMTGVISVSKYTLERYRQVYQIPASQVGFVLPNALGPNGLLPSRFPNAEQEICLGAQKPRLLSVARLVAEERLKGIDTVIQALPVLLKSFPDLKYIVVGDGSDRRRLQHLARQLQVSHAVEFCGFIPEAELERQYASCTIYVMPSASEGFGIAFIEAMAHGKPVVAAREGGAPEVVQHGVTGLLIDYGNAPQLAEAIKYLLEAVNVRTMMGQAGLRHVQEEYTFEVFCQRTARILSLITGGAPA